MLSAELWHVPFRGKDRAKQLSVAAGWGWRVGGVSKEFIKKTFEDKRKRE